MRGYDVSDDKKDISSDAPAKTEDKKEKSDTEKNGEIKTEKSEPIEILVKQPDVTVNVGETSNYFVDIVDFIKSMAGTEYVDYIEIALSVDNAEVVNVGEDYVITGLSAGATKAHMTITTTTVDGEVTTQESDPITILVKDIPPVM